MKFTKELPKESGYYWYVMLEYPLPVIGWWDSFRQSLFTYWSGGQFEYKASETFFVANIRIGDRIVDPKPHENTIE